MKAKFYYVSGSVNEFRTLKQAMDFAINNENIEVGITKGGIYQPLYRYNPVSEKYSWLMKVNTAKEKINLWLNSEEETPEDYLL